MAVPVGGNDRQPIPVAQSPAEERFGKFSPDSKWVAYTSDETGRNEVFVRPFPKPGPAVRISTDGGSSPFWRNDGKELYYRVEDHLMAVAIKVSTTGAFQVGIPASLFKAKGAAVPTTDGQRFLFLMTLDENSNPPITVILNWAGQEK
jgi:serine/threonine-protein kinase